MKTEHMMLAGLAFLLLMPRRPVASAAPQQPNPADPSNWYADQWARIYGDDLTLYGSHPAPSAYDNYSNSRVNDVGFNAPVGGR